MSRMVGYCYLFICHNMLFFRNKYFFSGCYAGAQLEHEAALNLEKDCIPVCYS